MENLKLLGAIVMMLSLTISGLCEACVTVNKEKGTYSVDESGCVK